MRTPDQNPNSREARLEKIKQEQIKIGAISRPIGDDGVRYGPSGNPYAVEIRASKPKCDKDPWGDCAKPTDEENRFHWEKDGENVTIEVCGKDSFKFPQKTSKCPTSTGQCAEDGNCEYQPWYQVDGGNWVAGQTLEGGTGSNKVPQEVINCGPGTYPGMLLGFCKNSRVTDGKDDGECCGRSCIEGSEFKLKIKDNCPDPDPPPSECNKDFTLEITCPTVTGSPGSKYKVEAHAEGVKNSEVTFTYCKNTCEPGNQLHSGKGATSYEGTYPDPGKDFTLIVTANFEDDKCDITKNAQCQIAGVADPTPPPTQWASGPIHSWVDS